MNERIEEIIKKLNSRDEPVIKLHELTGRSLGTIKTHWLNGKVRVPEEFQSDALRIALSLLIKMSEEVKDIIVKYEEV